MLMATASIDYNTFEPDWFDAAGATAAAVEAKIVSIVQEAFGPGGIPAIQQEAITTASIYQYRALQALKTAALSFQEASKYAAEV